MVSLIAKIGFEDNRLGKVKRRQTKDVPEQIAKAYVTAGLMEYAELPVGLPSQAPGELPSALPVGQALPQATVKKSKRGAKRERGEG